MKKQVHIIQSIRPSSNIQQRIKTPVFDETRTQVGCFISSLACQANMTDVKTPHDQLDVIHANDNVAPDAEGLKERDDAEVTWTKEEERSVVRKSVIS